MKGTGLKQEERAIETSKLMKIWQRNDHPHLPKAPITEALIDIQVLLPSGVDVKFLQDLHKEILSDYPQVKNRHKWTGTIQMKEGEKPDVASTDLGVDGFLISSRDTLQVVQYRVDGFTFSRLKPYASWEALRDEAKRLWTIYRDRTKLEIVTRIATRYINLIELPLGATLEEYFITPPQPPRGFPGNIVAFLNRQVIQDGRTGIASIVTFAMEPPPNATQLPVWLDIDTQKSVSGQLSDTEIWELLDNLAAVKNNIFFSLVTEKTVDMYQ